MLRWFLKSPPSDCLETRLSAETPASVHAEALRGETLESLVKLAPEARC